MISALGIGIALSGSLLALVNLLKSQPRPKPARIRSRDRRA